MRLFALLVISAPLVAQPVSAGLRAGVLATSLLSGGAARERPTSRFAIGPWVEFHFWRGAGVGIDFLMRRGSFELSPTRSEITFWRAEAPVTLVYRFRVRAKPFVRAGITFNRVFDAGGATACARGPFGEQFYCVDGRPAAELRHRGTSGFIADGGASWKSHRLRIEPEVRVTHWVDRNFGVRDSEVRSNLNEAALLLGVSF